MTDFVFQLSSPVASVGSRAARAEQAVTQGGRRSRSLLNILYLSQMYSIIMSVLGSVMQIGVLAK